MKDYYRKKNQIVLGVGQGRILLPVITNSIGQDNNCNCAKYENKDCIWSVDLDFTNYVCLLSHNRKKYWKSRLSEHKVQQSRVKN